MGSLLMKILLCQLRNHGDIIRTFPLIDAIKAIYPDWYIGFTCFDEMVNTCHMSNNIDAVFPQPRFNPVTDTQGGTRILDCAIFEKCVQTVKDINFDLYVDLHGVFQSALFGAMCNIKTRLGRSMETSKDGAHLFYTDICQINDKEINRMERHFVIFNTLFPEVKPVNKVASPKHKIIIFPGSSQKGILKRWDINRYVELANHIQTTNDVVFILGEEENELYKIIKRDTNCDIQVCNEWNKVEKELEGAKLVIGNDSAHVHLAIWKNLPVIEICGPLSPNVNGVWKYGVGETIYNNDRCYCEKLWQGVCDHSHKCLDTISVESVIKIVEKYL